jgi:hypothetical protein
MQHCVCPRQQQTASYSQLTITSIISDYSDHKVRYSKRLIALLTTYILDHYQVTAYKLPVRFIALHVPYSYREAAAL